MEPAQLHGYVPAPPAKKPRSLVLGCFGLVIVAGAGLFVLLAVIDLATGAENATGAIVGGGCMALIAALGALAAFFGFSKKLVPSEAGFEDAKRMRKAFMSQVDTSDALSQQINAAASLMLDRRYDDCIAAYRTLAEAHPDQRGLAYGQIGAALYFLGRYEEAIQHYEQAMAHGEDPATMRENIQEARDALR